MIFEKVEIEIEYTRRIHDEIRMNFIYIYIRKCDIQKSDEISIYFNQFYERDLHTFGESR